MKHIVFIRGVIISLLINLTGCSYINSAYEGVKSVFVSDKKEEQQQQGVDSFGNRRSPMMNPQYGGTMPPQMPYGSQYPQQGMPPQPPMYGNGGNVPAQAMPQQYGAPQGMPYGYGSQAPQYGGYGNGAMPQQPAYGAYPTSQQPPAQYPYGGGVSPMDMPMDDTGYGGGYGGASKRDYDASQKALEQMNINNDVVQDKKVKSVEKVPAYSDLVVEDVDISEFKVPELNPYGEDDYGGFPKLTSVPPTPERFKERAALIAELNNMVLEHDLILKKNGGIRNEK